MGDTGEPARPPRQRSLTGRGMRFLVTGVIVNIALYGVFWMLLRAGVDYRVGVTLVYVLGMIWGYLQNRLWSWRSNAPVGGSLARYLLVYAGIYVAHLGLVSALVELAGLNPLLATLVSIAVLVLPIFALLDRVVFKDRLP